MSVERWIPVTVESFGEFYGVSDRGRVCRYGSKSPSGGVLRAYNPPSGYPCVTLYANGIKRTFLVYRLVCRAFHGEKPAPGYVIAHCNGVREDSRADNLAWKTHAENMRDMVDHGNSLRGAKHPNSKLDEDEVIAIREMKGAIGARELGRQLDLAHTTVLRIWSGERWGWL